MQPTITLTVHNLRTAYTGTYSNDATMVVSNGTQMTFIVTANNPKGGVKELDLSLPDISKNYKVPFVPADPSGNVPEQLSIATDGTSLIQDTYVGSGRVYTVVANAVNFNNQPTTITFKVQVDFNPPSITTFAFDKDPITGDDGSYIKIGQAIHVNYAITDCNGCSVNIMGIEGPYLSNQTFPSIKAEHLPTPSGRILVCPTHPYATYTINCFGPHGTAQPKVLHQNWNAPQQQPVAGLMTFYYIVHDENACWTQSVVALTSQDGANAIQAATTDALNIQPAAFADFTNPDACPF